MSEAFEKCVSGAAAGRPVGIALFVEEGGGDWHARQLKAAMEARGAEVVITTLKACAFDTRLPSGIDIPGFKDQLPDGAFVRSISTGSLEQITLRLGILREGQLQEVPVSPRAGEYGAGHIGVGQQYVFRRFSPQEAALAAPFGLRAPSISFRASGCGAVAAYRYSASGRRALPLRA